MTDVHAVGTYRRGFIKRAGAALLMVQLLPSITYAAANPTGDGNTSANNLIIRSGPGFVPHTHDLWIPYAVLRAPPLRGVSLVSTRALGHTHELVLTHEQLVSVNRGGAVSLTGGSHTFLIALNHAINDRTAAAASQRRGA